MRKRTIKRKILPFVISFVMVFSLFGFMPMTASAAAPAGPDPTSTWSFVGSGITPIGTSGSGIYNGGTWSWDDDKRILTLSNINLTTDNSVSRSLYLPINTTLRLKGDNTIKNTYVGVSIDSIYVIRGYNLTITGDGSLNVTTVTDGNCGWGIGISDQSDIVITDSAIVTSVAGNAINSSCGIAAGFSNSLTIGGNATVTATGGESSASTGIGAGTVIVNDAAYLTAIGGDSPPYGSFGISTSGGSEKVIINGGIVTLMGNDWASYNPFTVPNGYKYWVNTNKSAPGTPATISDGTYTIDNTHKYAKIANIDISKASVAKISDQIFDGKAKTPAVKVTIGTRTLEPDTDYTVSYENNTNVGKATVKITGNIYNGAINASFNIIPKDQSITKSNNAKLKAIKISKGKFTKAFSASRYSYTLKLKKSAAKVKLTPIKADSKAKLQIKSGKKWKSVKSKTVSVKKGKSKTVTFRVVAEDGKTIKTYKIKVKRAK